MFYYELCIPKRFLSCLDLMIISDLENQFDLSHEGPIVTVSLRGAIPEESLPPNGIIVLEIQASAPATMSAFATIVFEVVREDSLDEISFSETYYTGHYSAELGLVFEVPMSLSQGYDDTVTFNLEGGMWTLHGFIKAEKIH